MLQVFFLCFVDVVLMVTLRARAQLCSLRVDAYPGDLSDQVVGEPVHEEGLGCSYRHGQVHPQLVPGSPHQPSLRGRLRQQLQTQRADLERMGHMGHNKLNDREINASAHRPNSRPGLPTMKTTMAAQHHSRERWYPSRPNRRPPIIPTIILDGGGTRKREVLII